MGQVISSSTGDYDKEVFLPALLTCLTSPVCRSREEENLCLAGFELKILLNQFVIRNETLGSVQHQKGEDPRAAAAAAHAEAEPRQVLPQPASQTGHQVYLVQI